MIPAEFTAGLQLIPYRTLTYGKVLGQGGFGRVYQGEWQHGEVAVKELLASNLSATAMTEFRNRGLEQTTSSKYRAIIWNKHR